MYTLGLGYFWQKISISSSFCHWSLVHVAGRCHVLLSSLGRLSCSNDVRSMRVMIAAQDMLEHQLWPVTGHTFQDILLISSSLGVPWIWNMVVNTKVCVNPTCGSIHGSHESLPYSCHRSLETSVLTVFTVDSFDLSTLTPIIMTKNWNSKFYLSEQWSGLGRRGARPQVSKPKSMRNNVMVIMVMAGCILCMEMDIGSYLSSLVVLFCICIRLLYLFSGRTLY